LNSDPIALADTWYQHRKLFDMHADQESSAASRATLWDVQPDSTFVSNFIVNVTST